ITSAVVDGSILSASDGFESVIFASPLSFEQNNWLPTKPPSRSSERVVVPLHKRPVRRRLGSLKSCARLRESLAPCSGRSRGCHSAGEIRWRALSGPRLL